jgi:hypothetical protein
MRIKYGPKNKISECSELKAISNSTVLELEVPTICLVTGGVSVRRDRRYIRLRRRLASVDTRECRGT